MPVFTIAVGAIFAKSFSLQMQFVTLQYLIVRMLIIWEGFKFWMKVGKSLNFKVEHDSDGY